MEVRGQDDETSPAAADPKVGLILDTDVLIRGEKQAAKVDFTRWVGHGDAYISAITCSELLIGVHRANTPARRARRSAYVERIKSDPLFSQLLGYEKYKDVTAKHKARTSDAPSIT